MLDDSANAKALPKLSQAVAHAMARSRSTSPTTVRTPSSGTPTLPAAPSGTDGTKFESRQPLYMSSLIREEKNSHSSSSSSEENNGVRKITAE